MVMMMHDNDDDGGDVGGGGGDDDTADVIHNLSRVQNTKKCKECNTKRQLTLNRCDFRQTCQMSLFLYLALRY